jgi:hypothetical protein
MTSQPRILTPVLAETAEGAEAVDFWAAFFLGMVVWEQVGLRGIGEKRWPYRGGKC